MNSKLLALTMAVLLVVLSLGVASPVLASEPDEMEEPELEEFRFEGGKVNKVSLMEGKGWIVVDYTKFKVTTDTDIRDEDGMLMKGVFVDLRFERHHDKLIATRIT
ncbi:MAG: hypothetical protein U1B77_02285, partial [Dehalococcoidales bacterium]|nr:hypothetical protein [Dehalococcoidales bacterium]